MPQDPTKRVLHPMHKFAQGLQKAKGGKLPRPERPGKLKGREAHKPGAAVTAPPGISSSGPTFSDKKKKS